MNSDLSTFAREYLKKNLALLTEGNREKFRMMYAYGPKCKDWETAMAKPIDQVVDEMSDDKLDWAMSQVENTLKNMKSSIKKPEATPPRRFSREELNTYMESRRNALRPPEPPSEPHSYVGEEIPFDHFHTMFAG